MLYKDELARLDQIAADMEARARRRKRFQAQLEDHLRDAILERTPLMSGGRVMYRDAWYPDRLTSDPLRAVAIIGARVEEPFTNDKRLTTVGVSMRGIMGAAGMTARSMYCDQVVYGPPPVFRSVMHVRTRGYLVVAENIFGNTRGTVGIVQVPQAVRHLEELHDEDIVRRRPSKRDFVGIYVLVRIMQHSLHQLVSEAYECPDHEEQVVAWIEKQFNKESRYSLRSASWIVEEDEPELLECMMFDSPTFFERCHNYSLMPMIAYKALVPRHVCEACERELNNLSNPS